MTMLLRTHKALCLYHMHCFIEDAIEENIIHINQLYGPAKLGSNGEQNIECRILGHMTEGIIKVNTSCLLKSLSKKSGLVLVK